jgi:hypothetical protein
MEDIWAMAERFLLLKKQTDNSFLSPYASVNGVFFSSETSKDHRGYLCL